MHAKRDIGQQVRPPAPQETPTPHSPLGDGGHSVPFAGNPSEGGCSARRHLHRHTQTHTNTDTDTDTDTHTHRYTHTHTHTHTHRNTETHTDARTHTHTHTQTADLRGGHDPPLAAAEPRHLHGPLHRRPHRELRDRGDHSPHQGGSLSLSLSLSLSTYIYILIENFEIAETIRLIKEARTRKHTHAHTRTHTPYTHTLHTHSLSFFSLSFSHIGVGWRWRGGRRLYKEALTLFALSASLSFSHPPSPFPPPPLFPPLSLFRPLPISFSIPLPLSLL
jgi:hypothetical protein